jgi:putative membrane protein
VPPYVDDAAPTLPYCGAPPLPTDWWLRWNLDPWLGVALLLAYGLLNGLGRARSGAAYGAHARPDARRVGALLLTLGLVSPLCALSVALFSVRVLQHVLLLYVAAPLLALALPVARRQLHLVATTAAFCGLFWFWHAPGPYRATFESTAAYWTMHVSLLVTAIAAWRAILAARTDDGQVPAALLGALAMLVQMGLLGAVLALAPRPLYDAHLLSALPFGLTALQDQQLGGLVMWVPGALAPLAIGLAILARILRSPASR